MPIDIGGDLYYLHEEALVLLADFTLQQARREGRIRTASRGKLRKYHKADVDQEAIRIGEGWDPREVDVVID